jgi:Fe-S cluster assembly iron-binding protein IscA
VVRFTDRAREILRRSHGAARRLNPDATVRLWVDGSGTARFDLVPAAAEGDRVVEDEGFVLYVAPGVSGLVDVVEPHDRLILRPPDAD